MRDIKVKLRLTKRKSEPIWWAFAYTSVLLLMASPEDAAHWYVRKSIKIEAVD